MKVRLYGHKLDARESGRFTLNANPVRVRCAEQAGKKLKYVLVYDNKSDFPTITSDPDLFAIVHQERVLSEQETVLEYQDAKVILIDKDYDDKFEAANGPKINTIEFLLIDA